MTTFAQGLENAKRSYDEDIDAGTPPDELHQAYSAFAQFMARRRLRASIEEAKKAEREGRYAPAEEVLPRLRAKYGL